MRRFACLLMVSAVSALTALSGAGEATSTDRGITTATSAVCKLPARYLPNAIQVHDKIICGGRPESSAGFAELRSLGVKTIISVDGAKPEADAARRFGLRYVHLPHGYDGISELRLQELAKAVRDLEGPFFIHCHHGKHRSPAAAAAACVAAGLIQKADAAEVLTIAGTSRGYRGLHDAVRRVEPIDHAVLDDLVVEFQETVPVPPLAEAMVVIERTHDNLKLIAEAGWRPPEDHPDLDPAHEALLMREHITELLRTESVQDRPEEYKRLLRSFEEAARSLEESLRAWKPTTTDKPPPDAVRRLSLSLSASCTACHRRFRDGTRSKDDVEMWSDTDPNLK